MGKIDKVAARDSPALGLCRRARTARSTFRPLVFESDNEMHGVITHFVRRSFRFEIECAETAVAAANRIKLWVEIKDASARMIDNP